MYVIQIDPLQTERGMWCTPVPKHVVDTVNCILYFIVCISLDFISAFVG